MMIRYKYLFLISFSLFYFSSSAQETQIIIQLDGSLSGKDVLRTSFDEQVYQSVDKFEGELRATLDKPSQISFYIIKNNGKIIDQRGFWVGEGTYRINGQVNDLSTLEIDQKHPFEELSREIEKSGTEKKKELILENLDKEVALNALISNSGVFSEQELELALMQVTPELKDLNSYKRFASNLELTTISFQAKEGSESIDFSLLSREGKQVSLSDFDGKYRLLEFSFTGCKPCLDALPEISEIDRRFEESIEVISIWNDRSQNIWLNGAKKHKELIRWTDLWDETGKVTQLYEVKVWPTYILISPQGKIEQIWNSYRKGKILGKMDALFGSSRP